MLNITLDHAINSILTSTSILEVNKIVDEIGKLTFTKLKDIKNNRFSAERLENAHGNSLMVKVLKCAEKRIKELKT